MKNQVMKKLLSSVLALVFMVGLLSAVPAQAVGSSSEEALLLNAVEPVLNAYKEYYNVENINITNVIEESKDDGGHYTEFFLNFDATLKFDSAMEIPKVMGIAKALNIEDVQNTDDFLADIQATDTMNVVSEEVQEEMASMHFAQTLKATADATDSLSYDTVNSNVASNVVSRLASFVREIEDEYIGESSEYNIGLRANIDAQGNLIELEYGLVDGYTDDISAVIPATKESMIEEGENQVNDMISVALSDVAARKMSSSIVSPASNPSFKYYRVDARDYANLYTSNASETICNTVGCQNRGNTIRQSPKKYNSAYAHYCCNDCANYVSQAMLKGRVPTDFTWKAGTSTWKNCKYLRSYFYQSPGYWNLATYSTCNAGGIILLHRDSGPYHVMMNVHNDGVTTKYSAHTNDRQMYVYTNKSLLSSPTTKVEYFIFDNVYPAH